ncbi:TPA: SDR family NAD(P)-dependent oxidoreductase [Kluyvera georgiana]
MTELHVSPDWLGLRGQVFAVTGAASGIGEAIATALAQQGANVALLDAQPQRADAVRLKLEHLPGKRVALACDVSREEQVKEAAQSVRALLGPCHGLVNAAGILRPAGLADISLEQWQTQLNVNLTGYLLCAREFAHDMRAARRGSIVHIGSISGRIPQPWSGAYSPGKAAVGLLSQQIAVEWGQDGIRSNLVAPGMIETALTADYYAQPGVRESREAFTASQRIGKPEDIANAVLFLLSEKSSYINGAEIGVDGGLPTMLMGKLPRPGFTR